MSAGTFAFTASWPVGAFTATLAVSPPDRQGKRSAVIEWAPTTPPRLSPLERQQYRYGRDAALAELTRELGVSAAVLEI